jgi:hypothetical protein
VHWPIAKGGRATLKMLCRKYKTQFLSKERNAQNPIALLNNLKRIALQQFMLRTQLFTQKILSAKNASAVQVNSHL